MLNYCKYLYIHFWGLTLLLSACSIKKPESLAPQKTVYSDSISSQISGKMFFTDTGLVHLLDLSLKENPDYLSAKALLLGIKADWKASNMALLPEIDLNLSHSRTRFSDYSIDGVGNFDTNFSPNIREDQKMSNPLPNYNVHFSASWEIDIWGRLNNQRKAARARYLAKGAGLTWLKTYLVNEVASAYYEVQANKAFLRIVNRNIELQDNALTIAKVQLDAGRINALALRQMEAQLYRTKALNLHYQMLNTRAEMRLRMLVGRFPNELESLKDSVILKLSNPVKAGISSKWIAQRPDVEEASWELAAAGADVKAAKAAFFPRLMIQPRIGYDGFNASAIISPASLAWQALGGLTAPIFYQRQLKAQYTRSKANKEAVFQQFKKTCLLAYNEVFMLVELQRQIEEELILKENEVKSLENAVSISNSLFTNGYATYLEVITAQNNVLMAQLEYVNLTLEHNQNLINLYRALGGGWE